MISINNEQISSNLSDNNISPYSSPQKFTITTSTPYSTYKPRVNFHSIESLISSSSSSTPISCSKHNDTGYNSFNSSTSSLKRTERKPRRKLSDWQNWYLTQIYEQNRYPSSSEQEQIASQINLPTSSIRIWFQNHRARYGKK